MRTARIALGLMAGIAAAGAYGVAVTDPGEHDRPLNPTPELQDAPNASPLAVVNGRPLSEALLDAYRRQRWGRHFQAIDEETALDGLITTQLLADAALEQRLDAHPSVAAELAAQRLLLLAGVAIEHELTARPPIARELHEIYEQEVAAHGTREYHARHILVEDEATARSLIEQIAAGGDFAKLAAQHSRDPSGHEGGDLGWFSNVSVPEALAAALAALQPHEVSPQPVRTEAGWHVLQLIEQRDIEPPSFEALEDKLRNQWSQQRIEAYIESLREKATVRRDAKP